MIIKQLTEIKTTINLTNTLVTYNKNSKDKTTQNSDNVIYEPIHNKNKELFKNIKNANKNLDNTRTLSITDNFTSTCFEHNKNEKTENANGKKTRRRLRKRKNRARRKKIMRLPIGTTAMRIELIRINRMFIFLVTAWLNN